MNDILPLTPSLGMPTFWYLFLTFLIGGLFGFSLERAGFGSAKRITEIFTLRDFRVFRVMFTAVLTGMLGAYLLQYAGLVNVSLIYIEKNYFWSLALGGLLFGFGFYLGGFCPGTAPVAGIRGRWDGWAFLFGAMLGIYGFAALYDAVGASQWFQSFYAPASAEATKLYGDGPAWPWILIIMAAAFGGFVVVPFIEKRFALRTVAELEAKQQGQPEPPRPPTVWPTAWRWAGPSLAGAAAAGIIWLEVSNPHPELLRDKPLPAADLGATVEVTAVSAQTLAGWLIENAYRANEGDKPNATVLDLRDPGQRQAPAIPGTVPVALPPQGGVREQLVTIQDTLANRNAPAAQPVVLITAAGELDGELLRALRKRRIWAKALDGGAQAWQQQVVQWQPAADTPGFAAPYQTASLDTGTATDAAAAPEGAANPYQLTAWAGAKAWLTGQTEELPPRFVFPNAVPPEAQLAVSVATKTAESGGCN